MKILLVSLNFAPEPTGIGKYSGEMAEGLVARGHEVTVVCAPPYYPTWTVQDGYSAWAYRIERPRPGLTVRRCPVWLPKRLRGPTRLLHLASFALSALPIVLGLVLWRPHVVLAVAPALACAPGAWLAARLAGAKAWLHVQDFEVDAAFELGILQRPSLRRAALVFERILMRRFDVVSTISSRMSRQLVVKGVPPEHTELIPNWVVLPARQAVERLADLRRSLGIAGSQTVCLFSGSLNRKQGLAVLVEAARLLKDDPRIVFVEARDPRRPEYGTLTLAFAREEGAPAGLRLQGWIALDGQNNRTTVRLSNQRFNVTVGDEAFRWRDPTPGRGPR